MDTTRLELLEQKIRMAAELIHALRQERASLEARLLDRDSEIQELRARLSEGPGEEALRELESLRAERREILTRVNRMLGILDDTAALAGEEDLLATVDDIQ